MYLFSRLATLRGNERRSLAWAVEMSNYVNAHSDHTVTLWRADFGYPVGTVAWSTWVESLAALNEGFAQLADDDGYHDLSMPAPSSSPSHRTTCSAGPCSASRATTPPPPGAVTSVTTAVVANGQYAEATAWGIEMAELVQQITSQPTMFLVDAYGTFGQVTWLSGAPDMATADAGGEAVQANPDYIKRLSDVGDLFVPSSGQQRLVSRIA